jgi:putative redox protein
VSTVTLKWTGGVQFLAADENGHTVVTDASAGSVDGANGHGWKPPDLLLVSLAACAAIDVVRILDKKRRPPSRIEISLGRHNAPEPPWPIERIEVHYLVHGRRLTEKVVRDAVRLAEEKYCSVAASLTSEIVHTFTIVNEDGGE